MAQREVALYAKSGPVESQRTNATGWAVFSGLEQKASPVLPGAQVRVAIEDPLFDPVSEAVVLCAEADLHLEVELRPVRGLRLDVFTHSQAGPADVPVVLRDAAGLVIFNQTTAGGAVSFECSSAEGLLAPGRRYVLRVEGTAFRLAEHRFVYVENQSVTFFLEPAGTFAVQLLSGGLPQPGVAVVLRRGIFDVATGVTDAAGLARFEEARWDLERGALYAVVADGAEVGYAYYEADGQTAVLDLQEGLAVKPVASAGSTTAIKTGLKCELLADGHVVDTITLNSTVKSCVFSSGVARGMVLRVSSTAAVSPYKPKEVELSGYGSGETLEVVLTKVVTVKVTVVDRQTSGSTSQTYVASARVQFRRADGKLSPVGETDGNGVYTYTCDEGDQMETGDHQTVLVSAAGYVSAEQEFVVKTSTSTSTELTVKLVKAEDIPYEITVYDSNSNILINASVFVGNAALEYRKLGTTGKDGKDGKVNGTLAAAELIFVRGEPYHLKVEQNVDGKTVTEYIASVSSGSVNKELLVPNTGKVEETVKLTGTTTTQLRLKIYN